MKCEAVVFDLGGVLIEVTQERAFRSLAARSAVSADELRAAIYHSPLFLQLESGACDALRFFDEIREQVRLDVAFEDFCSIYCDLFAPSPALIDVHALHHTNAASTIEALETLGSLGPAQARREV